MQASESCPPAFTLHPSACAQPQADARSDRKPSHDGFSASHLRRCPEGAPFAPGPAYTCFIHPLATQNLPRTVRTTAHPHCVHALAFSPSGRRLAIACAHAARLSDVDTGRHVSTILHLAKVWEVLFNLDGSRIATASDDCTARISHVETGQTATVIGHQGAVKHVRFSPCGEKILTGSADHTVKLTEVDSGLTVATLLHEGCISALEFCPDGRTFATASLDCTTRIHSAETGATQSIIRHQAGICALGFSLDGRTLATGSWDGAAQLHDVDTGTTLKTIGHLAKVWHVGFSPDGRTLITAADTLKVNDASNGKTRKKVQHRGAQVLKLSPDGCTMLAASDEGTTHLLHLETGIALATIQLHGAVCAASFSPTDNLFVIGTRDGITQLWEYNFRAEQLVEILPWTGAVTPSVP